MKHAAKAKKVWPLVTLLSPSLSLSGFGRPLNTPAAFHVHKCQGGIAPARAAAPPLRPRLLLFACQRSHSSAGQAFLSGAQVKDKIVVGSVSLNLWAEGAHHSLKARLKAVRCERPRLPHDLAGRHDLSDISAPHPLQVQHVQRNANSSRPHNAQNRPEAKGVISPGTGTRIKEKDCWHFLNFHPHAPNHSHISRAALRCTIPHPTPADPLALTSSNRPNSVPSTARLVYKCMPATCVTPRSESARTPARSPRPLSPSAILTRLDRSLPVLPTGVWWHAELCCGMLSLEGQHELRGLLARPDEQRDGDHQELGGEQPQRGHD